jgi:hypothetical protein
MCKNLNKNMDLRTNQNKNLSHNVFFWALYSRCMHTDTMYLYQVSRNFFKDTYTWNLY